jgi:hypothetical protein
MNQSSSSSPASAHSAEFLNDLLMQRTKMQTGRYSGPDYFTLD